ncbi:hypothetical protein CYMTET_18672 [Cymbomonas tetramitiformis]|uniref:Uncharacterized protein n=1 Tax=Cymbomonas tetramitiformis TaxID=36881 RepID=A0AAE0G7U1_9CHLO|nr:hypothetical protein CYMTET_18672 [Cymbomonas tetramitiformis]
MSGRLALSVVAPPNAYPGLQFQWKIPPAIGAEKHGYSAGQVVTVAVPPGVMAGAVFTATVPDFAPASPTYYEQAPPTQQMDSQSRPAFDMPAAPPPGSKPLFDQPDAPAPGSQKPTFVQPSAPPPGSGIGSGVAGGQEMKKWQSLLQNQHNAINERQELLTKYQDAGDTRGKRTYQKIVDYLQYDQFEVNIDGLEAKQDLVYEGLLPGEKVIMTLDCFIRSKRRTRFAICCWCFFTMGLYCIWMVCCMCIRPRKCGSTRVTLGVLNSGRLVYWHTDIQASMGSFPISTFDKDATTYRRYFRLDNLSMCQLKFQKRFDLFDENDADTQDYSARPHAHLRLFFDKFPVVVSQPGVADDDWVTTPGAKLGLEPVQTAMSPTSDYVPPEDCFVKYGECILRVYDYINFIYDLFLMIRGIFEYSIINIIKFIFLVFRNILNAYKCGPEGEEGSAPPLRMLSGPQSFMYTIDETPASKGPDSVTV